MNVEYINPFIESLYNLFTTMLGCEVKRGTVAPVIRSKPPAQSIVAIIGLTGSVRGSVMMTFPARTALLLTHRLLGCKTRELNQTVLDAMAEMVNIVAGGAKAKISGDEGHPADLSLPTVVLGWEYRIEHPSWAVWLDIPFECELGPFNMCVSIVTEQAAVESNQATKEMAS